MAKTVANAVDVEPIDRLEEKVKQLVGLIASLREERDVIRGRVADMLEQLEALHL
jgi:uncharacterized coiled-coil DUF342 family protein